MSEPRLPYVEALALWKREYFLEALDEAGGHQGLAADILGIHRNTMSRMLTQVGLTRQAIRQYRMSAHQHITTRKEKSCQSST